MSGQPQDGEFYAVDYKHGSTMVFKYEQMEGYSRAHGVGFIQSPAPMDRARPATADEVDEYMRKEAEQKRRQEESRAQTEAEAKALMPKYGFDPRKVGNRPRGFWEENGQLVICARDGGGNEPDCNAGSFGKFAGTECDDFDVTYRYYRFNPIEEEKEVTP